MRLQSIFELKYFKNRENTNKKRGSTGHQHAVEQLGAGGGRVHEENQHLKEEI